MLSILVFVAVAVVAEAGITTQPKFGQNHQHPSHSVRPDTVRSYITIPIGLSPSLKSHGPTFSNPFQTPPIVINSAQLKYATAPVKLHSAPISKVLNAPAFFIPHKSPQSNSQVFNSAPKSHDVKVAPTIDHSPPSPFTVFSSASIGHPKIEPSSANTHKVSPSVHNYEVQEESEKSISYSLSEIDYQFLKRYKTEGLVSPFNPVLGVNTMSSSKMHHNTHSHHDKHKNVSDMPHKPSKDLDVYSQLKKSSASNIAYQEYTKPSSIKLNVPEPVVIKHIYFHAPQPDFEEPLPAPVQLPPPRKSYNILFIKAPAQEQQNQAYIQQILQSRLPLVQEKTLIYVLSKKQDPDQVQAVLPSPKIAKPEVFFVNYQTKLGDLTDIRNKLVKESLLEDISPDVEQKRSLGDEQPESLPQKSILEISY